MPPRRPLPRVARLAILGALLLAGACSEPRTCYEGDFVACACDDGRSGFAACDAQSDAFGACGYCGTVPGALTGSGATGGAGGSGGAGGGGGTGGTELLGFMETCTTNAECESGLCHTYNAKGMKCTIPCQVDGDCPLPSPGCNMMGVCKAP